ncbi:sca1 complex scaffold protein scaa [Anaeramoeba flamelloides]|uniref:Sca1 complex scaffold protein scaa n=1 Tax=Anaeramoeba flamelloides TaxID=1746091 RepID=A0AAV7Z977_9EUKA|nr:sca1 complex scaffold protein scaa [Anaeramoeba flamelloides]
MSSLKQEIKTSKEKLKDTNERELKSNKKNEVSTTTIKESGIRIFQGIGGKYQGPNIKEKEIPQTRSEKRQTTKFPVFVDNEGNFYDIHYFPIEKSEVYFRDEEIDDQEIDDFEDEDDEFDLKYFKTKKDVWETQNTLLKSNAPKNPEFLPEFPNDEDFEFFKDYELAILKWHDKVEKYMGYLQLPQTIGASYHRPIDISGGDMLGGIGTTEDITEIDVTEMDTGTDQDTQSEVSEFGSDEEKLKSMDGESDKNNSNKKLTIEKEKETGKGTETETKMEKKKEKEKEKEKEQETETEMETKTEKEKEQEKGKVKEQDHENENENEKTKEKEDEKKLSIEKEQEIEFDSNDDDWVMIDRNNIQNKKKKKEIDENLQESLQKNVDNTDNSEKSEIKDSTKNSPSEKRKLTTETSEKSEKSDKGNESEKKLIKEIEVDVEEQFSLDPQQEYQLFKLSEYPEMLSCSILHLQKEEPWHSLTIPSEPVPEYYPTFGEYLRAYERWVQLCLKTLQIIPLHATQFDQQVGLKSTKVIDKKSKIIKSKRNSFIHYYSWYQKIIKLNERFDIRKQLLNLSVIDSKLAGKVKKIDYWNKMKGQDQGLVTDFINKLSQKIQKNLKKFKNQSKAILGKYHGVLEGFGPISKGSNELSYKALMRNDVELSLESQRLDCLQRFGNKTVEFSVAEYELQEKVYWNKIQYDEQYLYSCEQKVINLHFFSRLDYLNSWYNPKEITYKKENEIEINKKERKKRGKNKRKKSKRGKKGKENENKKEKEKEKELTYLDEFLSIINQKNLKRLLNIYQQSNSTIVHGKLSFILSNLIITTKGLNIFGNIIEKQLLKEIYWFTYGFCFFNKQNYNIYTYKDEIIILLIEKYGKNHIILEFINTIYLFYYLNTLLTRFNFNNHESFKTFLKKEIQKIYVKMVNFLSENINIFENDIFKGIANKSSSISSFYLFLFIQLLNIKGKELLNILFSIKVDFVFRMRLLTNSRFTHVQNASKIIWKKMFDSDFLFYFSKNYAGATQNILDDLFIDLEKNKNIYLNQDENSEDVDKMEMEKEKEIKIENKNDKDKVQGQEHVKGKGVENDDEKDNENKKAKIDRQEENNERKSEYQKKKKNENLDLKKRKILITKENLIPITSHITLIATEFCTFLYQKLSKQPNIPFNYNQTVLFSKSLFLEILNIIHTKQAKNLYDPMLNQVAKFLAEYTNGLKKLGIITSQLPNKNKNKKPSKNKKGMDLVRTISNTENEISLITPEKIPKISFSLDDIMKILDITLNARNDSYQFKKLMIDCLRNFLKIRDLYPLFIESKKFFEKILECSHQDSDIQYNKNIWKAIFQLIKYQEGFCSFLAKKEKLGNLLEVFLAISTKDKDKHLFFSSSNRYRYFAKILEMSNVEAKRLSQNKPSARPYTKDPVKSMKKDIEIIVDAFIKKNMHIKLDMGSKKFMKGYQGGTFVSISKIYHLMNTTSVCSKMLKEFKKSKAYSKVVADFKTMSTGIIKASKK